MFSFYKAKDFFRILYVLSSNLLKKYYCNNFVRCFVLENDYDKNCSCSNISLDKYINRVLGFSMTATCLQNSLQLLRHALNNLLISQRASCYIRLALVPTAQQCSEELADTVANASTFDTAFPFKNGDC